MSLTNIFWVGGTGANVAMAFARMQHIGLIKDRSDEMRHFFIDSPENFGTLSNQFDRNIGINEFKKLNVKPEPTILNLTRGKYNDFASFLTSYPDLQPLYEGIPDFDKISKTQIKDGNYYMPAIAAAMAWSEFSYIKEQLRADKSILCGSSYGGTGAGVIPTLARHLIDDNQKVDVVYLNCWVIDKRKADVGKVILNNEKANSLYLKNISKNLRKGFVDNLRCYLFRVSDKWQQPAPSNKVNNTTFEIENPYPYFVARCIEKLLTPAQGQRILDSGDFEISIDPKNIKNNAAFIYSYAYSRLLNLSTNSFNNGFDYILGLMHSKNPNWHLRHLLWDKSAFKDMYDLEFKEDSAKIRVREKLPSLLSHSKGQHYFDWTGFTVNNIETQSRINGVDLISYPTVFASYFYFISQVENNIIYREAYLALIALVARKQVHIEWDEYMAKRGYQQEIGALPLSIRDAKNRILGYIGEKGVYVWPLPNHIEWLSKQLHEDSELRTVLTLIYEKEHEQGNTDNFLGETSILGNSLNSWYAMNTMSESKTTVWFNTCFFRDFSKNTAIPMTVQHLSNDSDFSFKEHNLFVMQNRKVVIQYTNMLSKGRKADKIHRADNVKNKLILSYCTVYDFTDTGYEIEILHPAYIFTERAIIFAKAQTIDGRGLPVIPWPLRKDYVDCLEPANGWYANNQVCFPHTMEDDFWVDMKPHSIKHWGKCNEITPNDSSPFQIKIGINLLEENDITYGCKIWPCDRTNNKFLEGWNFYSILINSRYVGSGKRLSSEYEEWFYRTSSNLQWECITPVIDDDRDIRIVSWSGKPPMGISFEFKKENLIYGGYFSLPPSSPPTSNSGTLLLGIDFGTSATCSAYMGSTHDKPFVVGMNPSELIYSVFDSKPIFTEDLDFAWVPFLKRDSQTSQDSQAILNTILYSLRNSTYYENIDILRSMGSIEFKSKNANITHLPFRDYTIPGDTLNDSHINDPNICAHNIKWEGSPKQRMIYWKDFLTIYLLILQAHFYMKGDPAITTSYNQFDIYSTLPMKFLYEKEEVNIQGESYDNLKDIFVNTFKSAVKEVQLLSGLRIDFKDTVYESIAPIQGIALNKAVVIDVGGGTTDVSILDGHRCIATSSFVFAGNNPYRVAYPRTYGRFQELKENAPIVNSFMYLICSYTSLLVASAIYQTGLKEEIDQQKDIEEKKRILSKFKIYLFGRGWHLAKYDKIILKNYNKLTQETYINNVIKHNIIKIFNTKIIPKTFNDNFPQLLPINIEIDKLTNSKTQCAVGAITSQNRAIIDASDDLTFVGLSFKSEKDVKWYEHNIEYGIPDAEACIVDDISPAFIMKPDRCKSIIEKFNDINNGDPFDHGSIKRNFIEYLLEKRIGGYEGEGRRTSSITLNVDYISNGINDINNSNTTLKSNILDKKNVS